jgi:hypothetical protein
MVMSLSAKIKANAASAKIHTAPRRVSSYSEMSLILLPEDFQIQIDNQESTTLLKIKYRTIER